MDILTAFLITYISFIPQMSYSFGPGTVLGPESYIGYSYCEIVGFKMDEDGVMSVTCEVIE